MTTINPATDYAQVLAAGLGYDYIFAADKIRLELEDNLDALALGVVELYGDVAGTGSDTIRVTRAGNLGFGRRMTALGSETSRITPSTFDVGYHEVTVGLYGLAYEETYQHQVLTRERGLTLEELQTFVPQNWLATFRYQLCQTGSGFTTIIGSDSTAWSVDDELDLVAHFEETLGASGLITCVRAAPVVSQLRDSVRAESAFKFAMDFKETQKFRGMSDLGDLGMGLGIRTVKTGDIVQSGGGYQNFAMMPGAIGWAKASTGNIRPVNTEGAMYMPDFGLFISQSGEDDEHIKRFNALTWFGMVESNSALVPRARAKALV